MTGQHGGGKCNCVLQADHLGNFASRAWIGSQVERRTTVVHDELHGGFDAQHVEIDR